MNHAREPSGHADTAGSDRDYHVSHNGLHYGPFRLDELVGRALMADMLIWKPGQADWMPIESLPELAHHVRRVPSATLSLPPALPLPLVFAPPPVIPRPPRAAGVTVFGALNIAFGALGLLCATPLGLAMVLMPQPDAFIEIMGNPAVRFVQLFGIGIGVVTSVMLLWSGIGLLGQRDWGRRLAIGYAALAIIANLVVSGLLLTLAVVPMFIVAGQRDTPEVWGGAVGGLGGTIGGALGGIVYPVVLLAGMRAASVRNSLSGVPTGG